MPAHIARCSACILAAVLCAVLEPSQSQDCSTEKMENVTVDIRAALSKGIRGTDPVHAESWEACVHVCCLGNEMGDKKKCNLVVFNARRRGNYPNCYLFYYPSQEPFPVNQRVGLVTSRIITEVLKPAPTSNRLSHLIVNETSVPPQVSMFDPRTPTKPPNWLGSLPKSIGPKMKENSSHTNKLSYKTDGYSNYAKGDGANQSKSLDASLMHEDSGSLPPNVSTTVKHIVPTLQPAVKLPSVATGTQGSSVAALTPSASPSDAATTRSTAAYHRNTLVAMNPRKSTTAPQPAITSGTSSNSLHLLPSRAPNIFPPVSLPDLPVTEMESDSEGKKRPPHFGDNNILLATLLFGVMFLLLVTVQMGRKMLESLQRKRYTRLDYLINGMYANM